MRLTMVSQIAFQRVSDSIAQTLVLRFIPEYVRPNSVTAVRLTMTPIVLWCVIRDYFSIAIVLFCIASLTDWIDGAMARTRDQITSLGKILDPLADKLLIVSLTVPLVARHVSESVALIIILLEVIIVVSGLYRLQRRQQALQANWWGKIKFNFQVLGTLLLMVGLGYNIAICLTLSLVAYAIASGFGVVSLATEGF